MCARERRRGCVTWGNADPVTVYSHFFCIWPEHTKVWKGIAMGSLVCLYGVESLPSGYGVNLEMENQLSMYLYIYIVNSQFENFPYIKNFLGRKTFHIILILMFSFFYWYISSPAPV